MSASVAFASSPCPHRWPESGIICFCYFALPRGVADTRQEVFVTYGALPARFCFQRLIISTRYVVPCLRLH